MGGYLDWFDDIYIQVRSNTGANNAFDCVIKFEVRHSVSRSLVQSPDNAKGGNTLSCLYLICRPERLSCLPMFTRHA